jgi:class 3 adenylate cyclase
MATKRHNAALLKWLRALAIGGLAWAGLAAMQVHPTWLAPAIGVGAGLLALINVELGVLLALLALCVPVFAVNPIVGICLAVLLIASERYLGGGAATPFLLIGLAMVGAFFGPAWAAVALAGYLLGPAEGALAAIVSCLAVESLGVLTARPAIGAVLTGGAPMMLVPFNSAPVNLLSSAWLSKTFSLFSSGAVNSLFGTVGHMGHPLALLAQAALWGAGAAVTGVIVQRAGRAPALWKPVAGVAAGVLVVWAGDAAMRLGMGVPISASFSAIGVGSSLVVAVAWVVARETVFAPVIVPAAAAAATAPVTMAAEDADVDELLRLIATAEDKLASQHMSQRVVLITDMKSFSRMTEEDGSVASAKAIQRHRDILVPVINANHGCGKSTGGDGVVAAFESAADAIRAAVEGQQALARHNAAHGNEREIWIRMGLASGEVVLDNGGRPFIGAGLNLAARVMNLADGGQIFAAADVAGAAEAAGTVAHSFGMFELKNIASAIEIAEIMWADGQLSRDPRLETPAE